MSDDEIRIAIVKEIYPNVSDAWIDGYLTDDGRSPRFNGHDYPNDLNAIHEVTKHLKLQPLLDSGGNRCQPNLTYYDEYLHLLKFNEGTDGAIDATARQRAEAFLRAIGKWKDV